MTQIELIQALAVILEVDPATVHPTAELRSFRLWDSTAGINLLVVLDEHEITVEEDRIRDCKTVEDLIELTGCKRHEQRTPVEAVQEDCL
jgi:acyl carrier protein